MNKGWDRLICSSAESGWESWGQGGVEVPVPPGSWLGADGCLSPRVSGCCVQLLIQPLPFLPQPTSPEQLLDTLAKGNKNWAQRHTKASASSSAPTPSSR